MYTVAVKRELIARHYLIGGDWGDENNPHAHHYVIEVMLGGPNLDQHGYLADICDIETALDDRVAYFKDKMLNDMPEFDGLNPSIEHFARIICHHIAGKIQTDHLELISIKIWENDWAWAQYEQKF